MGTNIFLALSWNRNKFFHSSSSKRTVQAKTWAQSAEDTQRDRTRSVCCLPLGLEELTAAACFVSRWVRSRILLSQILPKLWFRSCRYSCKQHPDWPTLTNLKIKTTAKLPSPTQKDFFVACCIRTANKQSGPSLQDHISLSSSPPLPGMLP